MFSLLMKGLVLCKMNGTLDVTVHPVIRMLLTQFLHEPLQPNHLLTSLCSSNILCFCCWNYNNLLQFQNLTYSCSTSSKNIPCHVPLGVVITYHICVNISCRTVSEPPKHNAWEVVPLKYLRIHCNVIKCYLPRLFIYLLTTPPTCAIWSCAHHGIHHTSNCWWIGNLGHVLYLFLCIGTHLLT